MDKRQLGSLAAVLLAVWGAIEFFGLERTWNTQFRDPYVIGAQQTPFAGVRDVMPADAISGYTTDLEPNTIGWSAALARACRSPGHFNAFRRKSKLKRPAGYPTGISIGVTEYSSAR
jgi:hypothetical protein